MNRTLSMALPALVAAFISFSALNAQEVGDPRIGSWDEQKTCTDYDSLLRVFVSAGNGMTRMIVGDWVTASGAETVSADGRIYDTTAVLMFADGQTRQSRKQFVRRGL